MIGVFRLGKPIGLHCVKDRLKIPATIVNNDTCFTEVTRTYD